MHAWLHLVRSIDKPFRQSTVYYCGGDGATYARVAFESTVSLTLKGGVSGAVYSPRATHVDKLMRVPDASIV
jgi:hypothetical protein